MKLPYENELYELRKWIDLTNASLNMQFLHPPYEIQQWIRAIAMGIQSDYPFYAAALPRIANILFQSNGMGAVFVNPVAFGELVIIIRHIEAEPVVVQFWPEVHPRIVNVSRGLYMDGHCSTAAEKAVKMVGESGKSLHYYYILQVQRRPCGLRCFSSLLFNSLLFNSLIPLCLVMSRIFRTFLSSESQ